MITDRVVSSLRLEAGRAHPRDVFDAAWRAAKDGGYDVFDIDDDGTEYIADAQWNVAWKAAFNAAIAYAYPEMLHHEEAERLRRAWEAALRETP